MKYSAFLSLLFLATSVKTQSCQINRDQCLNGIKATSAGVSAAGVTYGACNKYFPCIPCQQPLSISAGSAACIYTTHATYQKLEKRRLAPSREQMSDDVNRLHAQQTRYEEQIKKLQEQQAKGDQELRVLRQKMEQSASSSSSTASQASWFNNSSKLTAAAAMLGGATIVAWKLLAPKSKKEQ